MKRNEKKAAMKADKAASKAAVLNTKDELKHIVNRMAPKPKLGPLPTVDKTESKVKPKVEAQPAMTLTAIKRLSHLKLGPELLARKATDAEIVKAFTESFRSRGCKESDEWILGRARIYMNIARKKAASAAAFKAQTEAKSKVG